MVSCSHFGQVAGILNDRMPDFLKAWCLGISGKEWEVKMNHLSKVALYQGFIKCLRTSGGYPMDTPTFIKSLSWLCWSWLLYQYHYEPIMYSIVNCNFFITLSTYLSMYLFIYLSIYLSIFLSIHLSSNLPSNLSVYIS